MLREFLNVTSSNVVSYGRYLFSVEMVVPGVDKNILEELEGMGFPKARATRALHYSGKNLALFTIDRVLCLINESFSLIVCG